MRSLDDDDDDNIPDDADEVPLVQVLEVCQAQLMGVVAEVYCVNIPGHLLPKTVLIKSKRSVDLK